MEAFVLFVLALLVVATWGVYRIAVVTKETRQMSALDLLGLVLALGLLAYLVVALLYPEKFE